MTVQARSTGPPLEAKTRATIPHAATINAPHNTKTALFRIAEESATRISFRGHSGTLAQASGDPVEA